MVDLFKRFYNKQQYIFSEESVTKLILIVDTSDIAEAFARFCLVLRRQLNGSAYDSWLLWKSTITPQLGGGRRERMKQTREYTRSVL